MSKMSSSGQEKTTSTVIMPTEVLKSKLDSLWSELQLNLPTISFDDDSEEKNDDGDSSVDNTDIFINSDELSVDNLSLTDDENFQFDSNNLINSEIEKLNLNNDNNTINNNNNNNNNDSESMKQLLKFSTNKKNNNRINEINSNSKKAIESVAVATKITKTIFDSSSSKLNMEIFEYIDIDELVDSMPAKETQSNSSIYTKHTHQEKHTIHKIQARYHQHDQNIMEKLHAMSLQISSSGPSSSSSVTSASKSVETETDSKSKLNGFDESDDLFELVDKKSFGNHVKTVKLDLRPSSAAAVNKETKSSTNSSNSVDIDAIKRLTSSFLKHASLEKPTSYTPPGQKSQPITMDSFMNGEHYNANSSSSDEEDDESAANRALWIEQYRKHKLTKKN